MLCFLSLYMERYAIIWVWDKFGGTEAFVFPMMKRRMMTVYGKVSQLFDFVHDSLHEALITLYKLYFWS